jgi:DUF4097 and DUF4098 domain-containing protein YvlB
MSYSPQAFTTATTANLGEIKVGSGFTLAGDGTLNNGGVTQLTGAATIKVSGATGSITLTDVGVTAIAGTSNQVTASASTGAVTLSLPQNINTTASVTFGTVTSTGAITDTGNRVVTSVTPTAGSGINISSLTSTGPSTSFTINNLGVTSLTGSTYLNVSQSTGSVTLTNLGVQTITGTANQVTASASTGSVTLSLPQSINTTNTPQFAGLKLTGLFTATNSLEIYTSPSISANAVTLDFTTGNTFALSSNAAAITANYTNVPTTTGQVISTVLIITQGSTAYIPSAVTINAVSQTIKWQGGSPPTGNINKTDIVSFTFICNGTTTPTVIGSLTTYG